MRRLALAMGLALAAASAPAAGWAHPLGNFTINLYSRLEVWPQRVEVLYVVDMAEIPTFQEKGQVDADGDGGITSAERQAYGWRMAAALARRLRLEVNGRARPLELRSAAVTFRPGQGGLEILRLEASYRAEVALTGQTVRLAYRDDNFQGRLGWREIIFRAHDGVEVGRASVPEVDRSNELRTYPDDLLSSPLDVREAHLELTAGAASARDGGSAAAPQPAGAGTQAPRREWTSPASIVAAGRLGVLGTGLAALLAALWGATHALTPGHGKAVVAAYLVGSRGTASHALYLGLTVTATHTLGVYALGLVTILAARFVSPEVLYPWLALASGLAVSLVGASLLVRRARALGRPGLQEAHRHGAPPGAHHHREPAHQAHRHGHGEGHVHGSHAHGERRDHGPHSHGHSGQGGERSALRSLLALGVAGGLVPCPSALVLLLATISLGRLGLGLGLVAAFSAGLAGVLTAFGLAFVYAGRLFEQRRPAWLGGWPRLTRTLPVGSAMIIVLAGLVMTFQALGGVG